MGNSFKPGFKKPNPGFGSSTLFKAKCTECGSECEVPFKPIEGRPVYCRECFRKKKQFQANHTQSGAMRGNALCCWLLRGIVRFASARRGKKRK